MRTPILLGLLLCHLACSGGGGIKRAGVDASPETANPTGASSGDSGGPATEVGGPGSPRDTAAMISPDTAPDRTSDQTVFSGDTPRDRTSDQTVFSGDTVPDRTSDQSVPSEDTNRPFDQAVASDRSPDPFDLRADGQAEPRQTPRGNYELLDDSPRTPGPDAGQCVRGFIRAYSFDFPTGAQTVKVHPVSAIASVVMDGTLSDGSGSDLRYDLKNPKGEPAGELLVWRQNGTWFAQITVYGSRQDSGCASGEMVFKY